MNIPLATPNFYQEEVTEIEGILKSGWLSQGKKTEEFENKFAEYCGAKHAVALNSGTAALHLSLLAHNIRPGDEVIVPTITFVATPNSVEMVQAKPVFCEVDSRTCNIDVEDIKNKITDKTKAIIPVHLYGNPAKMDEINKIAQENNLIVIEDAAQAHGAEYKGKKIGSTKNTSCFSFHAMKNMTTGEGGMLVSNNSEVIDKVKTLRIHGEQKTAWDRHQNSKSNVRRFTEVGYNYKMSDILSSLGLIQLKYLDENNKKREEHSKIYFDKLSNNKNIEFIQIDNENKNIFHMFVIKSNKRDELAAHLLNKGINTGIYYNPCHLQEVYTKKYNYKLGDLPTSEEMGNKILSIPMFPNLKEEEIEFVSNEINNFI
tara:strand:+ start:5516 stop:6634 length:1119 start_codon:yes stop_codon:yes gene_type:complete